MEIAKAAIRLFTRDGVAATSVDDIADAAGISPRTLRRYFPTKESCVSPLLTTGTEAVTAALEAWPRGRPLSSLIHEYLHDTQNSIDESGPDLASNLALIRLARTEPGLRALWLDALYDRENVYARILSVRTGRPEDDLHVRTLAAVLGSALRTAVEHYAWQDGVEAHREPDTERFSEALRTALHTVEEGLHY